MEDMSDVGQSVLCTWSAEAPDPPRPAVKFHSALNLTDQLAVRQLTRGFSTKAFTSVCFHHKQERGAMCVLLQRDTTRMQTAGASGN